MAYEFQLYKNPTVRVGNWYEDLCLLEDTIKEFERKRDNNELLIQHTRALLSNIYQEVKLSRPKFLIEFGDCIQLKNLDVSGFPPDKIIRQFGVVLAAVTNEQDIDEIQDFTDGCPLVSSPYLTPCARNTFIIQSVDSTERFGQNLLYGQDFALQLASTCNKQPLYLRCKTPLVDEARGPQEHSLIRLSKFKDGYTRWRVLYLDRKLRLEKTGTPFSPFAKVIIMHVMTGQCLAAEGTSWFCTISGLETGVSAHLYQDKFKRETAECYWTFITEEITKDICAK